MGMGLRAYARHRGVSPSAVEKALKSGRIKKEADGTIDPVKADAAWNKNTNPAQQRKEQSTPPVRGKTKPSTAKPKPTQGDQENIPVPKGGVPGYQESRAKKEFCQAHMAFLDLEERKKKLLRAEEVEREAFELARRTRDRLLGVGSRVADVVAAETDHHKCEILINQEIRIALEELSK